MLADWVKSREWARHAEIRQSWEPFELFINGHNAVKFMKGKHKQDLAELVLFTKKLGINVVHVQLRDDQRLEVDLGEWADRITSRCSGPARIVVE